MFTLKQEHACLKNQKITKIIEIFAKNFIAGLSPGKNQKNLKKG